MCSAEILHPRLCRVARDPLQDGRHLVVAQQLAARRADDLGDPLGKLALFDELPPLFVLVGRLVGFKLARRLVAALLAVVPRVHRPIVVFRAVHVLAWPLAIDLC